MDFLRPRSLEMREGLRGGANESRIRSIPRRRRFSTRMPSGAVESDRKRASPIPGRTPALSWLFEFSVTFLSPHLHLLFAAIASRSGNPPAVVLGPGFSDPAQPVDQFIGLEGFVQNARACEIPECFERSFEIGRAGSDHHSRHRFALRSKRGVGVKTADERRGFEVQDHYVDIILLVRDSSRLRPGL